MFSHIRLVVAARLRAVSVRTFYVPLVFACLAFLVFTNQLDGAWAQIGGHTAEDGPFVLDDAEDLDLVADGVMRDWVPDYVRGVDQPLVALALPGTSYTLAADQSPLGTLQFTAKEDGGYIAKGFGVPAPSVAGQSTLPYPGDMTSFAALTFLACRDQDLQGESFQVILETYPGPPYPHIYWNFTPAVGATFQPVSINLWSPQFIDGAGSLSLEEILSHTRFLYFYRQAGPLDSGTTTRWAMDDVRMVGPNLVGHWEIYE